MAETPTPSPEPPPGEPVDPVALDSPRQVIAPMWVAASGISPEARALVEPLLAGIEKVHGDNAAMLDRQMLAWWIGLPRHDKGLNKYLQELESIGFLVIYGGRLDKNGNRQARLDPKTGRAIPNTYALRREVPANYVGPRSLAEARAMFVSDRNAAHEEARSAGRKPERASIKRRAVGHITVSAGQIQSPETGEWAAGPVPGNRGVDTVSAGQIQSPETGEWAAGPVPGNRGVDTVSAGQIQSPETGVPSKEKRERTLFESSLSIGGSAPTAACGGPADDALENAVRDLVRRLPWEKTRKKRTQEVIDDAYSMLVPAILTALRSGWLTLAEAERHALCKLGEAGTNPVLYVTGGFAANRIPLPTPDDVLQLPTDATEPARDASRQQESAAAAETTKPEKAEPQEPASAEHRRRQIELLEQQRQAKKMQAIKDAAQRDAEYVRARETA